MISVWNMNSKTEKFHEYPDREGLSSREEIPDHFHNVHTKVKHKLI